jgi:hypothetical protein
MMDMTEIIDHVIEAGNPLLGASRFLTLRLPETWEIASGVGRPEIIASHKRGRVRWVANGDFWYVIFHQQLGWALEINGRMRPNLNRRSATTGETASVGGHAATVRWQKRRRGLPWRRHDVTFMTVDFFCGPSERAIKLEFSGWCPEEGFREVLQGLHNAICH